MPHLNSINEPHPFSDNSYALNANFQIISLTDTGYIPLLTELISHSCERSTLWVVPLDSFLNCGPADWTQDGQALYDWAMPQPPRSTSAVSVVDVFPWPLIWGQLFFQLFVLSLPDFWSFGGWVGTCWLTCAGQTVLVPSASWKASFLGLQAAVPSHHFHLNCDNFLPETISEPAGIHSYFLPGIFISEPAGIHSNSLPGIIFEPAGIHS